MENSLEAVVLIVPLDHSTTYLSFGQKQRLALASILAMGPGLLLLDEPTANLDPSGVAEVRAAVEKVVEHTGATMVVVEHRVDVWASLVDRVIVVADGAIAADGPLDEVLAQQGDALRERGGVTDPVTGQRHTPHLLVMTATPIPRTVAMTVFGDLVTSVLDELPAGRSPVTTHLVPWSRTSWVEGIWRRAAKEVAAGGRVYVVCPRIEGGDDEPQQGDAAASDADIDDERASGLLALEEPASRPDRPLASVGEWRQRLEAEPALEGIGVGVLTGRMSSEDKASAMMGFASGATPILVSTTVIEVGVDVPEASMMVILDADRFGLSQLHQLRGRVGRGDRESVCVAVTGVEVGTTAFHRLKAFASTTDGFALAEADLDLRSEGDVLGASQSGRTSGLDLLRVTRDARLIATARRQAERIVDDDPQLREHRDLAAAIVERLDEEAQAFLERA